MLFEKCMQMATKHKTVKIELKIQFLCKYIPRPLFFVYTDVIGEGCVLIGVKNETHDISP